MATKGITVKELCDDLRKEILAGNGDISTISAKFLL